MCFFVTHCIHVHGIINFKVKPTFLCINNLVQSRQIEFNILSRDTAYQKELIDGAHYFTILVEGV